MGDLNFTDPNIETDNVPWPHNNELIIDVKELCDLPRYSSDDDDLDTKSTVSVNDLHEYEGKRPVSAETSVGQLNIIKSSGVHIGNQSYYHGDVTIQQFVLKSKEAVKSLPDQLVNNANFTVIDGTLPALLQEEDKDVGSLLALCKRRQVFFALAVLIMLIGLTITTLVLLINPSESSELGWDSDVSENTTLRLYTRQDWGAQPSRGFVKSLTVNPPGFVIICHTASSNCTTFIDCSRKVRDIQFDHMGRGWPDLGMHFLVGGDGAAYTGLGWGKHGAHTIPFNSKSIAIYFIGNFMFQLPPKRQIRAAKLLIEEGVKLNKIAKDYKLFVHKQVLATESPGAALIQDVKNWPHWSGYESSDD